MIDNNKQSVLSHAECGGILSKDLICPLCKFKVDDLRAFMISSSKVFECENKCGASIDINKKPRKWGADKCNDCVTIERMAKIKPKKSDKKESEPVKEKPSENGDLFDQLIGKKGEDLLNYVETEEYIIALLNELKDINVKYSDKGELIEEIENIIELLNDMGLL